VREAARRVLNGETLYGVWTDLNRRGILTGPSPKAPNGARWHGRTLKRVLTAPAAIGCVETDAGELREVAEPVLDRATWDRLREVLYEPSRFTETRKRDWSNRRRYALSGLLWCSLCGHWLSGSTSRGKRAFVCQTANGGCGKIRIDYDATEVWVLGLVFARLDVPGVQRGLSSRETSGDDDELRQRIADAERALERLDDDHADGLLDRRRYQRQVQRIQERLDEARRELAEAQRTTFVVDVEGRSLRDAWDEHEHDVAWRRAFLEHVIDRVTIAPHPADVTSTLTRRRGESDEQLKSRRKEHQERIMLQRVRIRWGV
jgi:site-specific DNA recombinase